MTVQTDLFDYLDGVIAGSFHLTTAPPDAGVPLIEITKDDKKRTRTTGVTSPVKITEFQIECWERTAARAETLAESIIALLEDFNGTLNSSPGTRVFASRIFNEFAGSDNSSELFYSSFNVSFSHR